MIASRQWPGRLCRGAAALVTLAVLLLAAAFLTGGGALWRDEVNSVVVASAPSPAALWGMLEFESFPALWPVVVAAWTRAVGDSDLALRLLGVLGGLSLPAAIWFATRRLGRIVPLVSLAIVAANPEIVRWGSSVRAWGLGAALAVVTVVLMWEAVERPRGSSTLAATLAAVLAVQCTYQNAIVVLVAGAVAAGSALLAGRRHAALRPLAAGAAAAVSLTPYLETLGRASGWGVLNQVSLDASVVLARLFRVAFGAGSIALAAWVGIAGAALWLVARRFRSRPRLPLDDRDALALYLTTTMLVAAAVFVGVYTAVRYPPYAWYYLAPIAIIAVCSESAVARLAPAPASRVVLAGLALTVVAGSFSSTWTAVRQPLSNLDAIGARLTAEAGASDLIVVYPWLYAISLERYYDGPVPLATVPELADVSVHRFDLLRDRMLSDDVTAGLLGRIETALRNAGRVWVVGDDPRPVDGVAPASLPPPPLAETGWAVRPYVIAWGGQVGAFLRDHAISRERLRVEADAQPLENAGVLVFAGWRD